MSEKIKNEVKKQYSLVIEKNQSCGCGNETELSFAKTSFNDNYSLLKGYNREADYGLGCGIPTNSTDIKPGDTVVDLGSGAGNDVFVARSLVGEKGKVIGIDMTEAMIEKANLNKEKSGFSNIEFRLGEIEDIPVGSNSVDVVISNCVMNLVPDKNKAYNEVLRILKPGGKFSISDIVVRGKLPERLKKSVELYVSCVAGAVSKEKYLEIIKQEGFEDIKVTKEKEYPIPDSIAMEHLTKKEFELYKKSKTKVLSITVTGIKPV